jgi:hypothetical protein
MIVYGIVSIVLTQALKTANQRSEANALRLTDEIAEHQRTQQALLLAKAKLEQRMDQQTGELTETAGQLQHETTR